MTTATPMTESQIAHMESWATSPMLRELLATIRDREAQVKHYSDVVDLFIGQLRDREARLRRVVEDLRCMENCCAKDICYECCGKLVYRIAENADLLKGESPC